MPANICVTVEDLMQKLIGSGRKYDFDKIRMAGEYAEALHEGQFRCCGRDRVGPGT